ncbi:UvrD-helicase domain-containing protein [uncultured Dokdonia sp.]|uniref:UvrD-helicase domain-containing protein n=1 Tax=uncultured Dokdonia sp. TaxID=575653 RepID=UPI00260748C7|nr:UvrD-helicase domain-containing protein [uncultured Dokdonia sp.]
MWYLIGGAVIVASVAIKNAIDNNKKRKEEELKQKQDKQIRQNLFDKNILKLTLVVSQFKELITLRDGSYFDNNKLSQWLLSNPFYPNSNILSTKFKDLQLTEQQKKDIEYLIHFTKNSESIREQFNNDFLQKELSSSKALLSDIDNGKSLDGQQREAIIRDEDNSLVIAGAGCGKTTTIMGKVKYLTERLNVLPNEILLISFTKKSANDLVSKLNFKGINASTFHKLGLDIIKQAEHSPPSIYDQSSQYFIENKFKEFLKQDEYLKKTIRYFTDFMRLEKDDFQTENFEQHIQHLKDQNYRPYKKKIIVKNGRETILREIVKSQEECKIANFLLFNGLKYEYEQKYEINTRTPDYRQYAPDFTIYQNNKKIYLEHYAIDKDGNVPPFFANETINLEEAKINYNNGIKWKRDLHLSNKTTCLETYSYNFKEGTIYKSLEKQLNDNGFHLNELTNEEKWALINETASDEVKGLTRLFNTFLSLYKSNNLTFEDLKSKVESLSGFNKTRTVLFINLFNPILWAYEKMLQQREQIDFNDMINKATDYVVSGAYKSNFKYLIVDEFQDISFSRYNLLKALKEQTNTNKVFAVGDDWQSIFRFTGSDIKLFNNFEDYFGFTYTSKIETTYRFGQPLIDISSDFVMSNPSQIRKDLKTKLDIQTNIKIYYSQEVVNDDTKALEEAIKDIVEEALAKGENIGLSQSDIIGILKKKSFYILGRYNFDINRIDVSDSSNFKSTGQEELEFKYNDTLTIKLSFFSVHRSKGLEADFVFILNCNSGKIGFPSEMMDDPVLNLILGNSESYPNSEERRLFYVALSRAKEKTVCISNANFTSKFIIELNNEINEGTGYKCPRCKTGDLTTKRGISNTNKPWAFKSCSNYAAYNCTYKVWL